ncbi:Hypp147 [Branchiostoma lanceolatum]|uniref:Hypp147 protein n=1 Tax=Branchiostoma lanceolatum TaxID=7740 RepID=A0A8J9V7V7_BRALA|nr:Hypp147 [Branchiostoma lanceolatum]
MVYFPKHKKRHLSCLVSTAVYSGVLRSNRIEFQFAKQIVRNSREVNLLWNKMASLQKVRCSETFLKGGNDTMALALLGDFLPWQQSTSQTMTTSVFDTDTGEAIADPVKFIQENGAQFSVYSFDLDQRVLGLVKVREEVDIRKKPFLYQAQRENAEELLLLPFDVLPAVADALTESVSAVKNIFLHSTGRCGSTLMCKGMDVMSQVQAVSEPDVFTLIFEHICTRDVPLTSDEKEEIVTLLKHSVTLLNFWLLQNDPSRTVICYKLRSAAVFVADLMQKAVPQARNVFLYRDLTGFYDSSINLMFSGSYWRYFLVTALRLDAFFLSVLMKNMPRMFSYEQLLEHKDQIILKVLEKLDIDVPTDTNASEIRAVFGVDSQEGSAAQSRRRKGDVMSSSWVGTWERNFFPTVLAHFDGDVNDPNFVMPNNMVMN